MSAVTLKATLRSLYEGMNKTEQRRAIELEAMVRTGQIYAWYFEGITFKLAHDVRVTPDFLIVENDGTVRLEETKGFLRDDARIKYAVLVKHFPFPLRILRWAKTHWEIEEL